MKKYVKNRVYDTDTAEKVVDGFDYESGNYEHSLYKKRNGEFFYYDWSPTSGESITPITFGEAKEFARESLSGDEYDSFFGKDDEGYKKVQTSISLSRELFDKLNSVATIQHKTKSELIADLIRKY